MKLHVGSGRRILDGWTNVDIQANPMALRPPEIIADAGAIPLPDACADELMSIHLLEHIDFWRVQSVLIEWRRLLKPGGCLILELPNIMKAAANLLAGKGDQLSLWGIYGDPGPKDPHNMHRWGWSPQTLKSALLSAGFKDIREAVPQWHKAGRDHRDMRIEARK